MTCIVGIINKNKVYIGGDSAGVTETEYRERADSKVFIKDSMLFGFTSSFRMGQLIRYTLKIPKQTKNMDDYTYLVTLFIDSLRDCLKKGGFAQKINEEESGGTFLLGYKNKLYTIYSDYQVSECLDNYTSVGCGSKYALGSLFSTMILEDTRTRIKLALESAVKFSNGVLPPFNILEI